MKLIISFLMSNFIALSAGFAWQNGIAPSKELLPSSELKPSKEIEPKLPQMPQLERQNPSMGADQFDYYERMRSGATPSEDFACSLVTAYEITNLNSSGTAKTDLEISDFIFDENAYYFGLEKDFGRNSKMKPIRASVLAHVRWGKIIYNALIYRVQDSNSEGEGAIDQASIYFSVNNGVIQELDRVYAQTAVSEGYNGGSGLNGNNVNIASRSNNNSEDNVNSAENDLVEAYSRELVKRKTTVKNVTKTTLNELVKLENTLKLLSGLNEEQKKFLSKFGDSSVSNKSFSLTLPVTSENQSKGTLNCIIN